MAKSNMWTGRALSLIRVIDGTRINIQSETLLEDLEDIAPERPEIAQFLEVLLGWSSGDRDHASELLASIVSEPRRLIENITSLEPCVLGQDRFSGSFRVKDKPRHTVKVREMPDGEVGITIGTTEYVMPKAEAMAFSGLIVSAATEWRAIMADNQTTGLRAFLTRADSYSDANGFSPEAHEESRRHAAIIHQGMWLQDHGWAWLWTKPLLRIGSKNGAQDHD